MKFVSTRGGVGLVSFEDALFSGYANDGGLFVPENIPQIPVETLTSWKNLSYAEIVEKVVSIFVTEEEIPRKDLKNIISSAFKRFDIDEVIRIASFDDLHIAELWHGPTMAFKDLAMSVVGEMYRYFLEKRRKNVVVIVGTSGDTGSSAIEAVRGKENIDIIVILPHNRISKIQELMMTTVLDDNVHVYAADGFSDDFEITIKNLFNDGKLVKDYNLCSINSINWGRVMVQIAHHIYMYLQVAEPIGKPVDIVIPTGGCGNIASGVLSQTMGVPVKFACVVNNNDIVHRMLRNNDFTVASEVVQTLACSMDIQIPPNIERVMWIYSGKDFQATKEIMQKFDTMGSTSLPKDLHQKMKENIRTAVVTDEEIVQTMKKCWEEHQYIACPHTCAALAYHYGISKYGTRQTTGTKGSDGTLSPSICVSTASICKFPEILAKAEIEWKEEPKRIKDLFHKPAKSIVMHKEEDWEQILREKISFISQARKN
ncbi:threonine synthase-like 2 isoform X1 [Styela clava]